MRQVAVEPPQLTQPQRGLRIPEALLDVRWPATALFEAGGWTRQRMSPPHPLIERACVAVEMRLHQHMVERQLEEIALDKPRRGPGAAFLECLHTRGQFWVI